MLYTYAITSKLKLTTDRVIFKLAVFATKTGEVKVI